MRGLSARERILVALVIAAVIGVAFYLVVYVPQTDQLARLDRELASKTQELGRLKALAATREAKEREYGALVDQIRLVEMRLPPEREIPNLIRALQDVAREIGIKLTLLRPGPTQAPTAGARPPATAQPPAGQQPQAQPPYRLFRLDLGFEGTYRDLIAYMGRLENFPRFLVLRQISLAPTTELPRLRVTVQANTFVLPREQPPAQP
ncbi:MAG: type 4a pilus biogenesis protein PilO [Armatimonadota bacterium]|nr:type 4a pilus biogenesis protein PilO [Armatimonadota bacterium]MDR7532755.1 type 4a pilus biogenesis protein PilO [Armatimonadota bacterium]MDR7537097.1 type 4a pilus biogenesis protein PilO [Armatimonadota bacterium]